MKPLLPPGCLLRIDPMTEPPQIGDIVLYLSEGGRLVSHRVVALTPEGIQTKGDSFVSVDGAVGFSRVLGKVVAVEEPFRIPLDSRFMRWTGRMMGFVYPKLYRSKMVFCRLFKRRMQPGLQGHNSQAQPDLRSEMAYCGGDNRPAQPGRQREDGFL